MIRKVTPAGQVSTVAGTPGVGGSVDGNASDARFLEPTAIAIDASGNLFVTDYLSVRKITPAGMVSTVAAIGTGLFSGGRSTGLFVPGSIAVDGAGNLYVTNGIGTRRIAPSGELTMLEGVATKDNVIGTATAMPRGVAVDAGGTVYLATLDRTIARVGTGDQLVIVAGAPGQYGAMDGVGAAARFGDVVALAPDRGNLVAAEALNNTIRRITPDGVVTTIAGTAGSVSLQTGALPGAFANLGGMAGDGKGNLFVVSGNAIVKITLP